MFRCGLVTTPTSTVSLMLIFGWIAFPSTSDSVATNTLLFEEMVLFSAVLEGDGFPLRLWLWLWLPLLRSLMSRVCWLDEVLPPLCVKLTWVIVMVPLSSLFATFATFATGTSCCFPSMPSESLLKVGWGENFGYGFGYGTWLLSLPCFVSRLLSCWTGS